MDAAGIAVVCVVAYPIAALLFVLRPLPWWALHVILAIGTLLITIVVELSGIPIGGFGFFYLWVAVYAVYFFSRAGAARPRQPGRGLLRRGARSRTGPARLGASAGCSRSGRCSVIAVMVRALKERVDRLVDELSRAARTDDLSGLLNRRGFNQRLGEELRRATRSEQGLALVVGDLDRFKEINDRFGHPAGDEALRRVSRALRECARESDTVARLGGEEFALVLPYTEPPGALAMAERIRKLIRDEFSAEGLTISFGIAAYPEDGDTQDQLMRAADSALYTAKELGRDRIEAPPGAAGPAD